MYEKAGIEKGDFITDINGNFTIDANNNDVIQISYVGFASKDVRVKNDNNIQIQMTEDQKIRTAERHVRNEILKTTVEGFEQDSRNPFKAT